MSGSQQVKIDHTPRKTVWVKALSWLLPLALLVFLASCGDSGSSGSGGEGGTGGESSAVETPEPTGPVDSVVWNLPFGEPISLDPAMSYNPPENSVLSNVCEALLRLTPDYEYEPALAESVSHPSPDKWVYEIRRGVNFWDGTPLTTEDVVFSLQRHLDPKVGSFLSPTWTSDIQSIEETGPYEVTMTMKNPNLVINDLMVSALGTVFQKKYFEEAGDEYGTPSGGIMCTGPFKLDEWRSGDSITLAKNEDYWDKDLQPQADEFKFTFLANPGTITSALLSGEIDGTYEAPVTSLDRLEQADNGELYLGRNLSYYSLYGLPKTGPVADVRIREAVSLATDRAGIAKTIYGDTAEPLNWVAPSAGWAYGREIYQEAYDELPGGEVDLDAARKLVEEAGSPSETIPLAVQAGDDTALQIANSTVSAGEQIGLNMDIRELQPARFLSLFYDENARSELGFMITYGYLDIPEPLEPLQQYAIPGALVNFLGLDDPSLTKKITTAAATDDDDERAELTSAALQEFTETYAVIPAVGYAERLFMNEEITGAPAAYDYLYYPWAARVGASG